AAVCGPRSRAACAVRRARGRATRGAPGDRRQVHAIRRDGDRALLCDRAFRRQRQRLIVVSYQCARSAARYPVSRKRGKKHKAAVEAVPEDILAEGSGPVRRVGAALGDAIATVEDVVTTDDIATTDDVVTADDVVATAEERPG